MRKNSNSSGTPFNGFCMTFRNLKCGAFVARGYSSDFEGEIVVIRKTWKDCYNELAKKMKEANRVGRIR